MPIAPAVDDDVDIVDAGRRTTNGHRRRRAGGGGGAHTTMSAPMSTLGRRGDRPGGNDQYPGGAAVVVDHDEVDQDDHYGNIIGRWWRSDRPIPPPSRPAGRPNDSEDDDARGYHRDLSPLDRPDDGGNDDDDDDDYGGRDVVGGHPRPPDYDGLDASLLNGEGTGRDDNDDDDDGGGGGGDEKSSGGGTAIARRSKRRARWATMSSSRSSSLLLGGAGQASSILPGTEEEERIMDECSFFYTNMDDEMTTMPTSHHHHRRHLLQDRDDDMDDGGGGGDGDDIIERMPHAHRITTTDRPHGVVLSRGDARTSTRRGWTERRYRRRLRRYHCLGEEETRDDSGRRHYDGPSHDVLDEEHRRVFFAAHSALNGELRDKLGCRRAARDRRGRRTEYDVDDYDLELAEMGGEEEGDDNNDDPISAKRRRGGGEGLVTRSSLAMRGGLIRLPADNVRLVCDPQLQPGILSIETCDGQHGGGGNNDDDYDGIVMVGRGDDHVDDARPLRSSSDDGNGERGRRGGRRKRDDVNARRRQRQRGGGDGRRRRELAYVLTVDVHIYRRIVQEMGDSYRLPCGMYYCCHVTATGGNYVGIGVAVAILSLIFVLVVAGMIAWGID